MKKTRRLPKPPIPAGLRSLRLPHLRLYQQILISLFLVVLVPLLLIGLAIYTINQNALRKEVSRFAELTAQSLQTELQQQIQWEQHQARLVLNLVEHMDSPAEREALLTEENYLWWAERTTNLPAKLVTRWEHQDGQTLPIPIQPVQVATLPNQPKAYVLLLRLERPNKPVVIMARRFSAMEKLIDLQAQLFTKGLIIVNEMGRIIAGPQGVATPQLLSEADRQILERLAPGEVKRVVEPLPTAVNPTTRDEQPDEDNRDVEKVFIKVPELQWSIVLESPYHVRQTYIRRAREQTLFLMGGYVVLIICFSLFYVLGINRNFRQLLKATKALTQGNYSRRIRLLSNATTPYEIVVLSAEFNRMAKRVADAWDSTQQLNTELKQANHQLAKLDELKSTLIDTVSHELRTPLTSIKGYTSRLLRYDDTLDPLLRQKSLKIVKQQADRLSRMVDDLLVIPELETARLRVYPDNVMLYPLLDRVIQVMSDKSSRDIVVTTREETSDLTVLADPDRLEQVLVNMLDNAIKYSPDGSAIQVNVQPEADHVLLRVINQSAPIPPDMLEKLFEKFTRLDDQLTRTTRGSGLGLFITRGLVESMGGRIELRASDGFFEIRVLLQYPKPTLSPEDAVLETI
jgi:signal transduction histidine kinase